jgi:tetratricopeptide (TPR) repeat protein
VGEARAAAAREDRRHAAACYGEAEALWRGPSLEGFAEEPFAMGEGARLEELRRCVLEERVDAKLGLGHHADLVAELEAAVTEEPLRERRWGQLMLALYRSGRQADALRAYQRLRAILGDELGLEPGEALRSLERAVATSDPALGASAASVHVAPLPSVFVAWAGQPFIGRHDELGRLESLLDDVIGSGARRLVVIAGEPGIGKTRLAAKLAVEARANGAVALYGRCDEGLETPFQPFVEALEQLAAATDMAGLVASLGGRAASLAALVPAIQAHVPEAAARTGDPLGERHALFDAVDATVEYASESAPVVVVLDDLHWADATSLMLLRYLARSSRPARLLMVGTYRHTELDRGHPLAECLADLRSSGRMDRVVLHGLGAAEVGELVESWRGEAGADAFVAALCDQTLGNPFFVQELLRHLAEQGSSSLGDLPEGIREVIGRRLSRLVPAVNDTLRVAAVIGRDFDVATLAGALGSSRDEVLDALDAAIAAEVVTEMPEPLGAFAFTHALVRQTLYDDLSAPRRAQLHWRVGQALRVAHPGDLYRQAAHLADGVLAGDPIETADAALAAGDHAREVLAFEQAAEQYARSVAMLDDANLDDPDRRYRALAGLATAHLALANRERTRGAVFAAADIARAHGWTDRLAEVAGLFPFVYAARRDDAPLRLIDEALAALGRRDDARGVRLLCSRSLLSAGVLERLDIEDTDAAVAMARRLADPALVRLALSNRAMAFISSARLDQLFEATAVARNGTVGTRPTSDHALATRAFALGCLRAGDRVGFETSSREACGEFEELHQERDVFLVRMLEVLVAIADGRFADAEQLGRRITDRFAALPSAAEITTDQLCRAGLDRGQHAEVIPVAERTLPAAFPDHGERSWLANAYHDVGRTDDAHRIFERYAAANWAAVPQAWSRALALRHLAELCARFGDADRAASLRALLEPWSGQLLIHGWATSLEGAADRALGQLETVLGDFATAQDEFEAALAIERGFGATALVARTLYWYARLLRAQGSASARTEADRLLDEALETTERLGMTMLHRQCRQLRRPVA